MSCSTDIRSATIETSITAPTITPIMYIYQAPQVSNTIGKYMYIFGHFKTCSEFLSEQNIYSLSLYVSVLPSYFP